MTAKDRSRQQSKLKRSEFMGEVLRLAEQRGLTDLELLTAFTTEAAMIAQDLNDRDLKGTE